MSPAGSNCDQLLLSRDQLSLHSIWCTEGSKNSPSISFPKQPPSKPWVYLATAVISAKTLETPLRIWRIQDSWRWTWQGKAWGLLAQQSLSPGSDHTWAACPAAPGKGSPRRMETGEFGKGQSASQVQISCRAQPKGCAWPWV